MMVAGAKDRFSKKLFGAVGNILNIPVAVNVLRIRLRALCFEYNKSNCNLI